MFLKLALIADLHGNYTATLALEKALNSMNIDRLVCLGDIVGKGPSSDKTFDWAFRNCNNIIAGNWDLGISLKRFPNDHFYWNQLGAERMQKLADLPLEWHFEYAGVRLRCLHGRPIMDELLPSHALNSEFEKLFIRDSQTFNIVAYADTHRQLLRTTSLGHVLNTGSIGNATGVARLSFATLDIFEDSSYSINFHSLPYDKYQAAQEAMNCEELPFKDAYLQELFIGKYTPRKKP